MCGALYAIIGPEEDNVMEKHGDEVEVTTEEASGGIKNQGMRYVLGISLLLAIVVLSAMWMTGAFVAEG